MSRGPRIVLPELPHHVVQRGHNRQVVFTGDGDYSYYLRNLREEKERLGCRVYAYCLMANHVHLILDPGEDTARLASLMKILAGRQTRLVNAIESRSGTLWEGRFRSSPIATIDYLFACCRYVELNPVRAGVVDDPVRYRWSSYAIHAGRSSGGWLDDHPAHLGIGNDPGERATCYREWVAASSAPAGQWNLFRAAIQRGQVSADTGALGALAFTLGKRFEQRGPGRPRKHRAEK